MTLKDLITNLQLLPHPEGGYFKETYRSSETTTNKNGDLRTVSTAIYFLLKEKDKSHFHRIQSDELWFFHLGQVIEIVYISGNQIKSITLGNNLLSGELLSFKIPANTWFASKLKYEKGFALVSCTVAPGFDFADFELAGRDQLHQDYPHLKNIINEFTNE